MGNVVLGDSYNIKDLNLQQILKVEVTLCSLNAVV